RVLDDRRRYFGFDVAAAVGRKWMRVDHRLPPVELLPDGREGGVPQVLVLVARHETNALRLERIQGVADFLERSLVIEKRQRREAREAALVVARELSAEFVREARDLAAFLDLVGRGARLDEREHRHGDAALVHVFERHL